MHKKTDTSVSKSIGIILQFNPVILGIKNLRKEVLSGDIADNYFENSKKNQRNNRVGKNSSIDIHLL